MRFYKSSRLTWYLEIADIPERVKGYVRKRLVHPRFYVPVYQIKTNSSPYLEDNNNQQCNVTFWKEISY